jgi:hypothetical protein
LIQISPLDEQYVEFLRGHAAESGGYDVLVGKRTVSTASTGQIKWRSPAAVGWLSYLFPLGIIVAIALQPPWSWYAWAFALGLLAVVDFHARGFWRRRCVLDDRHLRAKGRYATRSVELRDLRQVGVSVGRNVWVQTHHPLDQRGANFLCLNMIPMTRLDLSTGPTTKNAVDVIRSRAEAAGAQLDPPLTKPTRPRSSKPLIFSM